MIAEINHQLEEVEEELEASSAQGRLNYFLVRQAGGIARLLDRHDLVSRLEAMMSNPTVDPPCDALRGKWSSVNRREA